MARWLGSYEERSLEVEYCAGIRKKPGYILNLMLIILILTKNRLLNTSLHSRDCFAGFFFDFAKKQEPARICAYFWYFGLQNLVRPNQLRFSLKFFFFRSASMEIKLLSALELLSKRGSVAEQFAFIYFTFRTVACQRTCAYSFFHFAMAHPVKTPPQYKM